jgi:hypothetical protein
MNTITVTDREHALILASLRFWQRKARAHDAECEIAEEHGPILIDEEIDGLCLRTNVRETATPKTAPAKVAWGEESFDSVEECEEAIAQELGEFLDNSLDAGTVSVEGEDGESVDHVIEIRVRLVKREASA